MNKLFDIKANAERNGFIDCQFLDKDSLFKLEPELNQSAKGGLLVPGEGVVDSWMLPAVLAHNAIRNGSQVCHLIYNQLSFN